MAEMVVADKREKPKKRIMIKLYIVGNNEFQKKKKNKCSLPLL